MIYLSYNDQPSGVFSSQVSDVCNYLNEKLDARIRLVAVISMHSFFENRKKIKAEVPGAWVIPAIPKAKYHQFTMVWFAFLCLITGNRNVIARNVIATKVALFAKNLGIVKRVVLDGRGAIAAEWNEYQVVPDEKMKHRIHEQEKSAVLESDFRIAVSSKLIDYWKTTYGYNGHAHVVIPCTLNTTFRAAAFSKDIVSAERQETGFGNEDIIMVYSGSTAGWQSFNVLGKLLGNVLGQGKQFKLLFLSGEDENINGMKKKFPGQVFNKWISHSKVQQVLAACDYGILFRENSVTNQVASPTKFAEYLSAGLPVIISENLGDYTNFVTSKNCGMVIGENGTIRVEKQNTEIKQRMLQLAIDNFTKAANHSQYEKLIKFIKSN